MRKNFILGAKLKSIRNFLKIVQDLEKSYIKVLELKFSVEVADFIALTVNPPMEV